MSSSTSFSYSGYQKRSPSGGVSMPLHSPGSGFSRQPTNPCSFTHFSRYGQDCLRADARRQRQAAHAAEGVGVQLHLLGDDVVGLLDEPLDQLRMLAGHHLIGPRRDQLDVGADFFQLRQVRAAAEHRRVQRLPDVVVGGEVAAAAVRAAMRKDLRLVHIQTVWRRDVAVRIDDHPCLPSPWRAEFYQLRRCDAAAPARTAALHTRGCPVSRRPLGVLTDRERQQRDSGHRQDRERRSRCRQTPRP